MNLLSFAKSVTKASTFMKIAICYLLSLKSELQKITSAAYSPLSLNKSKKKHVLLSISPITLNALGCICIIRLREKENKNKQHGEHRMKFVSQN